MRNTITKGTKTHTEGETNERMCNCSHCGAKLKVGEGFKVVGLGSYKFIHENERGEFIQNLTIPKKYLHGMEWNVTVYTKRNDIDSLSLLGWTTEKDQAVRNCNTLNLFKGLKGLNGFRVKIELQTENGSQNIIEFANINYDTLRKRVIIETKRLLTKEKYGEKIANKRKYNDFPDFLNI